MIKNYMEIIVEDILDEMLINDYEYKDVCHCELCIEDIKAKALNNIMPRYVTCKKGEVFGEYFKVDVQNRTNIIMEIAKAIESVSKNKQHD